MEVAGPFLEGRLVRRYKRFLMDLRLDDGSLLTVHCPNSGSMEGCLKQGAVVVASKAANPKRKLTHTAEWIRLASGWVGINTHRTNAIVGEALRGGLVPELAAYSAVRAEVPYDGTSRVDFLLEANGLAPCYVEVKNATLPTLDGAIAFPDTKTERGLKHLHALARMAEKGNRSVMLFLVNRGDGSFFRAARERDPAYAEALWKVHSLGVEILVRRAHIAPPVATVGEAMELRWSDA